MSKFNELNRFNSTLFYYDGLEFRTVQDPAVSDDGQAYEAIALNSDNEEYYVKWEVIDFETTDESSACNWENPDDLIKVLRA